MSRRSKTAKIKCYKL